MGMDEMGKNSMPMVIKDANGTCRSQKRQVV